MFVRNDKKKCGKTLLEPSFSCFSLNVTLRITYTIATPPTVLPGFLFSKTVWDVLSNISGTSILKVKYIKSNREEVRMVYKRQMDRQLHPKLGILTSESTKTLYLAHQTLALQEQEHHPQPATPLTYEWDSPFSCTSKSKF